VESNDGNLDTPGAEAHFFSDNNNVE
jgi:hypothetical protein